MPLIITNSDGGGFILGHTTSYNLSAEPYKNLLRGNPPCALISGPVSFSLLLLYHMGMLGCGK